MINSFEADSHVSQQQNLNKTTYMEQVLIIDNKIKVLNKHESILNTIGIYKIIKVQSMEGAQAQLNVNYFDFILSDHFIEKNKTALNLISDTNIPITTKVFIITDNYERSTYESYVKIRPIAFLKKDFQTLELFQLLSFTRNFNVRKSRSDFENFNIKFSVKIGDKYKIIELDDIEYFEVDGKYLNLYSANRKYNLRSSLTEIMKKIPVNFLRVHGSYLLNMNKVISINPSDQTVELLNYTIPFSRNYKKILLDSFFFI